MKLFKKIFGKRQKKVVSLQEDEFENVTAFLNSNEVNKVTDSRSTAFFKEASDILKEDGPNYERDQEVEAIRDFESQNEDILEYEEISTPKDEYDTKES